MPSRKTFASFAEKIAAAIELIEVGKGKQAITLLKKVRDSSEKRAGKVKGRAVNKAKRPLTGYMLFASTIRPTMKAKFPDLKVTDLAKKIGAQWRALSDAEKAKYTTTKAAAPAGAKAKAAAGAARRKPQRGGNPDNNNQTEQQLELLEGLSLQDA